MKHDPNNNVLRTEFRRYAEIPDKFIKRARHKHNKRLGDWNENDYITFWEVINTRIGSNSKKTYAVENLPDSGKV